MPERPKHRRRELEALLEEAEARGWRVTGGHKGGYFKLYCPCPLKHKRSIHHTPSDPNYERNVRSWLRRTCWE